MIRKATQQDAPAIERLLRSTHARSKYAGIVGLSDRALADLVMYMIAAQGQNGPQGSYVAVAEEKGKVVGFIAGVLDRIYHFLKQMRAADLFLINEGSPRNLPALVDGYMAWAIANPKVHEITLSWTDTVPGGERIAKLFERKGMTKMGEIYCLVPDRAPPTVARTKEREAA